MVTAVVDIETDRIDATQIHCIVACNYTTGKEKVWVQDECKEFASWSKMIDKFIMHNGISFDAPILNRLTGSNIRPSQIRDTLIESQGYVSKQKYELTTKLIKDLEKRIIELEKDL